MIEMYSRYSIFFVFIVKSPFSSLFCLFIPKPNPNPNPNPYHNPNSYTNHNPHAFHKL